MRIGTPKLKMSFTNGIDGRFEEAMGFDSELAGDYPSILALIDEMRKAIVMFEKRDNERLKSEQPKKE